MARAMVALPVITHCYDERVAVLRELLRQTLVQRQARECPAELADCFASEVVRLHGSITAMQAEVQQGKSPL